MNANPSGSRTPSAGSRGGLEARREFAAGRGTVVRPFSGRSQHRGLSGCCGGKRSGTNGGTRRAKMVCRGALVTRRTAQGRVGDRQPPRHVARHLVPHLLLSAKTSAPADAVRPGFPIGARPRIGELAAGRQHALRRAAQPGRRHSPRLGASDPIWSIPASASYRRRPANYPEGKESWRHEHRPLAARFLVRSWRALRLIRVREQPSSTFTPSGAARATRPDPAVEQLIREGYPIKRIDIDEEPDLPRRYHVEAVPAFIVVDRDGRELGRLSGPRSASDLARFYKTSAAKARPAADSSSPVASRGDRGSGDDDPDEDRDADNDRIKRRKVAARGMDEEERRGACLQQSQAVGDRRAHPGHR